MNQLITFNKLNSNNTTMSQWNNSNSFNNTYQENRDRNDPYEPQTSYNNQQYQSGNNYVSFNEFINQIQMPSNSANFSMQPQTNFFPTQASNYFNGASTSYNQQTGESIASADNVGHSSNGSSTNSSTNKQAQNSVSLQQNSSEQHEVTFKSNLTATATEFVPKGLSLQQDVATTSTSFSPHSYKNPSKSKNNDLTDSNWRDRPSSSSQTSLSSSKHHNGSKRQDGSNRNHVNGNRNTEKNNEPNARHQDRWNNENKIPEAKIGMRSKHKPARNTEQMTFYNSRNGQEKGGQKYKNWVGSQRVRTSERNYDDDEQFANSYLQYSKEKGDKKGKSYEESSPMRSKNKPSPNHDKDSLPEMTQRERLSEQLDKGTLECLVCCDRVRQTDPVWHCNNCYHVLHLRCIRKWAMSSMHDGKWRCPACQNATSSIPAEYRCMCGSLRNPQWSRGNGGAHTCQRQCQRDRACVHPCVMLCHPGPCPPCQATVQKKCGCGAETRSVLCSSKLPQVCNGKCRKKLNCGAHECEKDCHEGSCGDCAAIVTQVCYCGAGSPRDVKCTAFTASELTQLAKYLCYCGAGSPRDVPCTSFTARELTYSCGAACSRVLSCGEHVCRAPCHPPPCPPCALLPESVLTCPCGKMQLEPGKRKLCTEPIPLCGNICAKPFSCGPDGDKHFCKQECHEGPCPDCPDKTVLPCRCGHTTREVPCIELPNMLNNVFCQKKCNKRMSCGRHRCRTLCCALPSHRCNTPCGRSLTCQLHRCDQLCHTGHCAPCSTLSFTELRCACGAQVVLPPVRCGTRPPACSAPCRRPRPCGHEALHSCHVGACPPCVVLTTRRCYGNHEERKTIPCSQDEFSCGLPCGRPLPCGKHTCIKTCHQGPCDTSTCTQPCAEPRPSCGHECAAPCHHGNDTPCPSAAPCRRTVVAVCNCGRRSAERPCFENTAIYNKIVSAMVASKMQENETVDMSELNRPGASLKTLECDDECRVEQRTRQMALALQIRNPSVSSKLAPRYSDSTRAAATRDPAFAASVHRQLSELVQLAKKSKQKTRSHSFPSMNRQKRQFIHELCEHFGCESVSYDAEPNRNVVATADRERSWLPAMSVLEVLAREAGKRRVPGPVLRQATTSAKTTTGWATLTSTNAWAARSQPKPPPAEPAPPKIDYFDNPPE